LGAPAGRFAISGIGSNRQLGADDGLETSRFGGAIELRCAVESIAIEQCNRRIAQFGGALDERRRQRGAVEK
jgi:hypothetical protein